jgi:hypothetical protein
VVLLQQFNEIDERAPSPGFSREAVFDHLTNKRRNERRERRWPFPRLPWKRTADHDFENKTNKPRNIHHRRPFVSTKRINLALFDADRAEVRDLKASIPIENDTP